MAKEDITMDDLELIGGELVRLDSHSKSNELIIHSLIHCAKTCKDLKSYKECVDKIEN